MTLELHSPAALPDPGPIVDRNGIERSADGRPYIVEPCPDDSRIVRGGACVEGRVPGKRPGTTKKCPKCKGEGRKRRLLTRCTTFVGALEDRQQLETWKVRTALVGLAADHRAARVDPTYVGVPLLDRLGDADPDDRDTLDRLADEAFTAGDGYVAAQKGTDLHAVLESLDLGEELGDLTLADRRDVAAWVRLLAAYSIEVLDVERFVVQPALGVGGTYDRRVVSHHPALRCEACETPGGDVVPKVLDLKTGRVDYGGGKIRQQLAMYAYSDDYDPSTGRTSPQDVCRHRGFVVHLPAGTGEARLLSCDLVAGWADVQLSAAVREHRRTTKSGALLDVALGLTKEKTP